MAKSGFELACTVRGCGAPLSPAGTALRCPAGHAFDRAREGYWNLLQPQDRRSKDPGDSPAAIDARERWIARGWIDPLADAIDALSPWPEVSRAIDVGCGEGSLASRLFAGGPERLCGIDLSVRAIRAAARRMPDATWIVANADRFLPFPSGSIDLAFSLFGRRPTRELARVLRPGGALLVAIPASDDLVELREAAQGRGDLRDRTPGVIDELAAWFALEERHAWRRVVRLDRAAIEDALAMTYRGARGSERERRAGLEEADVTLSAVLLRFRPA